MSKECNKFTVTTSEQNHISLWTTWSLLAMSIWKKLSKRSQPTVIIGVVIMYLCVMSLQIIGNPKYRRSAARGQAKIIPVCCYKKSKGDVPLEAGHGILAAIFMFFVRITWKIGIAEALYASLRGWSFKTQLHFLPPELPPPDLLPPDLLWRLSLININSMVYMSF